MKITRITRRADGLTVGEHMDRNSAFLRSIGIDCKDGAPTFDERRDHWQERVRRAVLDALDSVSPDGGSGWKDQDLPALFPAIDKHAEVLFERHELLYKYSEYTDPRAT